MILRKVLSILAVAAISSPALAASLLSNGSFENISSPFISGGDGGQNLAPGSTAITDWTVFSNNVAPLTTPNSYGITPEDGNVSLDLQSYLDGSPYGGVEQMISTQVGATYELDFYVGSLSNGTSAAVSATAGTSLLGSGTSTAVGSGITWTLSTFDFTAASTSTNIKLQGTTASDGGIYIGLDNASVTLISSAAPLPASIYGGAALFGILGLSGRSRKIARLV